MASSVYLTRTNLKRHNTTKMDNLYNLYSLNELKFMIVFGLILFGLCQYNKTTLAWVFLVFPVIYVLIQNLIIHIHVSSALQSAPKGRRFSTGVSGWSGSRSSQTHGSTSDPPPPPQVPVTMAQPGGTALGGDMMGSSVQGNYAYF